MEHLLCNITLQNNEKKLTAAKIVHSPFYDSNGNKKPVLLLGQALKLCYTIIFKHVLYRDIVISGVIT